MNSIMKSVDKVTYYEKGFVVGNNIYSTLYGDYEINEYEIVAIIVCKVDRSRITIYATPTTAISEDGDILVEFNEFDIHDVFTCRKDAVQLIVEDILDRETELKIIRERYVKELQ